MKTHLGVGKTESAMKKFMTVLSVVLMAAGFVSCKKEINVYGPAPEKGELKVRFIADASLTKVGLTPDENDENFSAVWDKNDYIGIVCTDKNDSKVTDDEILACWVPSGDKSTPGYFETSLDATSLTEENAPYSFVGYWPQGIEVEDLFPGNRIQNGDKYNGDYDIMVSDKTAVNFGATETNAVTVVLPMKRQTSIAYFHIKSELNEKIVSATLTTGEGEFIAASNANLSGDGFSIVDGCGKNSITLRIEGDMYSSDFKLWFNVLPVDYTSMKLVVETDTHSFTMSKKAPGSWKAGELNSVVIENVPADKWAEIERPSADKTITLTMVEGNLDTYKSEDDVVTAAFAKNDGTIPIAWNSSNSELRLYPKGTLTITAKTGSSLKNIKYTANINAGGSNTKPTVKINNVKTTNLEWTGDSETVTLAVSGSAGNVGFKSIKITYTDPNAISDPIYKYSVTCQDVKNGTIQISPASAKVGETVLLTPQPNEGYEYLEGSLKAFNTVTEKEIPIDAENKFEMPAANVNVSAEFSLIPTLSVTSPEPYASNLTNNGGNGFSIPVVANQAWAASIKEGDANDAGVILMQSEGEGGEDNKIIFKFDSQNTDVLNAKSTVITVGSKSGSRPEPIDITIVHLKRGAVLVLNNEDKANVTDNVAATDIAYTLNVTNANFSEWNVLEYTVAGEIQSADKYFITKTQDNTGSIKISFPANKDESSENTIIVKVGYEGIITRTLTLTQAAAQARTPNVTLDFSSNNGWGFPNDYVKQTSPYTNDGHTVTLYSNSGNGYKYSTSVLLIGKANATLTFEAFDFDVDLIKVTGPTSGASKYVTQNIYVGETAVSTETTGANGTNKYEINSDYQSAGTIYTLKITNDNNTQISKIEIYGGEPKKVSRIEITGNPKKEYVDGDVFNPSGLKVTGYYDDGSSKEITTGIKWTFNPETLSQGTTSVDVTATYGSLTSTVTVSGLTVTAAPTLESIVWEGYTTSYTVNDTFKKDGTVTATYSDASTKIVTSLASFSEPDMSTAGDKKVTVSYGGKETQGTIKVSAASGVIGRVSNLKDLTDGVYIIVGQQKESSFGKLVYGTLDSGRLVYTSSYTSSPSEINSDSNNEKWRLTVANDGNVNLYSIGGNTYLTSSSGKFKYVSEQSSATSYTVSCNENGVFSFANGKYYLSVNNSSDYWRDYAGNTAYSSGACLYLYRLSD